MKSTKLTIELTAAFAPFLKRVEFDDFKRRAVNEDEALLMKDAAIQSKKGLAESSHAPR